MRQTQEVAAQAQQQAAARQAEMQKQQAEQAAARMTREQVEQSAKEMQQVSLAFNKKLQFVVDYQSKDVTVKVIDPNTDKVIKELPPEELARLRERIREELGSIIDELA
jgi:flagellar protein FlaG